MRKNLLIHLATAISVLLAASVLCLGQSKKLEDATKQSQKAARVLTEIMRAPDKAIPKNILDGAECVAVFPDVIKAGFIVGGRGDARRGRKYRSATTKFYG